MTPVHLVTAGHRTPLEKLYIGWQFPIPEISRYYFLYFLSTIIELRILSSFRTGKFKMARHIRLALFLLLATPLAVSAQVTLKFQTPDKVIVTSTVTAHTIQVLTLAGMVFETRTSQKAITRYQAGTRGTDGIIQIDGVIEAMKVKASFPEGVELTFDSTRENKPEGTQFDVMLDLYKALATAKTTRKLDKENRCLSYSTKIEGFDKLAPELKDSVKDQLDNDYLRDAENQKFKEVPFRLIQEGDSWETTFPMRLGGGQILELKRSFAYKGTTTVAGTEVHLIEMKVTAAELSQDANANTPAKITGSDLKVESSSGKILFDNKRGLVTQSELKFRLVGELKLDINGMELPGKLDLSIDINETST
jgi:hypothetical protein